MMPRLRAEEALAMVDQLAIGTGAMKEKSTARRVVDQWRQDADGGRRKAVKAQKGSAALASMGISVEVVT